MNERDRPAGSPRSSPSNPISHFVARLTKLDAGGRARLQRNAGRTLDEARNVYQVFFSLLPPEVHRHSDQEDYFLVATLFPIGTRREQKFLPNPSPPNLGASLQIVRRKLILHDLKRDPLKRDPDRPISLDRRMNALLNTDREQLSFRLSQTIRLLTAHEVSINWFQLLRDVQHWNDEPRRVQRCWADHYFRDTSWKVDEGTSSNDTDEPTSTEEVEP